MKYSISDKALKMLEEPCFELFKHEGLFCCVQRMSFSGNLNGYVAVQEGHSLYGKEWNSKVHVPDYEQIEHNGNWIGMFLAAMSEETKLGIIGLDLAINVHGGLTYSRDYLSGIKDDLLGKLWWFGFDCSHAGDLRPYQSEIDRRYDTTSSEEYRNFEYVIEHTKKLAEQLSKFQST